MCRSSTAEPAADIREDLGSNPSLGSGPDLTRGPGLCVAPCAIPIPAIYIRPMKPDTMIQRAFRCDDELWEDAKAAAEGRDITTAEYIRRLIADDVQTTKKKARMGR